MNWYLVLSTVISGVILDIVRQVKIKIYVKKNHSEPTKTLVIKFIYKFKG